MIRAVTAPWIQGAKIMQHKEDGDVMETWQCARRERVRVVRVGSVPSPICIPLARPRHRTHARSFRASEHASADTPKETEIDFTAHPAGEARRIQTHATARTAHKRTYDTIHHAHYNARYQTRPRIRTHENTSTHNRIHA